MKWIIRLVLVLLGSSPALAQKETFDVTSYTVPPGWQKQATDRGVQLAVTDGRTGGYALAIISPALPARGTAAENFSRQWASLVQGTVAGAGEPTLAPPAQSNGWEIVSGTGSYTDRGGRGGAILLCATGYGRTTAVILMTNTSQFQNDIAALIQSLDLARPAANGPPAAPAAAPSAGPATLAGLWTYNLLESNGRFANGTPMYTAGYFRREYQLNADGTYRFRLKNWSVFQKEILFVVETGTWKARGNQLALTPAASQAGWWAKAASGRTTEWGPRLRAGEWKAEAVTYTFELHYYSGMNETDLLLTPAQPTERDGRDTAKPAAYSPRAPDKSLIDDPPDLASTPAGAP